MNWDRLFDDYYKEDPNNDVISFCRSLKSKAKVLDIGIGGARHIKLFQENGLEAYGFDISKKAVNIAKKSFPDSHLITHDMLRYPWPYKDNYFDGIISINVLHHCDYQHYVKSIAEIHRILKKGGAALITIASKKNHKFGKGEKIDDHTYITDIGVEKGIPHMFVNAADARDIFKNFHIIRLEETSTYVPKGDEVLKECGVKDQFVVLIEK